MAGIQEDVSNPLTAVSTVMQGMAAKNQTMKDGPPAGGGGGSGGTVTKPSDEEKKSAYDQYKKEIEDIWKKYNEGKISGVDLALGIGQAVSNLAMKAGPDALKALGDLAKLKK